jgi:coenzyme F420-0:L-glutamate ligase / coenzyme F420-1:gamma-L-glutamate ligase
VSVGPGFSVFPLTGIPELHEGDDLAALILERVELDDLDIVVVAQKAISKIEGRVVRLDDVVPSERAIEIAGDEGDPQRVEWILREARRIVRVRSPLVICETRHGFICASAGVDQSNTPGAGTLVLLPLDPDASAEALRRALSERTGKRIAVIISDSFGRPFRRGTVGIALGAAGLPAVIDWRGHPDLFGRKLEVTETGFADEIAAAASLVQGQADEGTPIVLVRGLTWSAPNAPAAALVRPAEHDLFR